MPTPRLAAALPFLLSLAACGGPQVDPAVGTWSLDGAATFETSRAAMLEQMGEQPQAARDAALEMMRGMFAAMEATLTLEADGTLAGVMRMPNPLTGAKTESRMSGTWVHEDGTLTMRTRDEGTAREETQTATVAGDELRAETTTPGGRSTLVFTRTAR